MSPLQAGANKNKGTNDNLFLLRGTIDHLRYLQCGMNIIFYDFKQCFDSIWLKDSLICLWEAGIRDEMFYLYYLINKTSSVTVYTPCGKAEPFTVNEVVKQGTCSGPTLCSISTGQYCKKEFSPFSGIYVGNVKLGPLAFVDDIADMNKTESHTIK